MEIVKFLDYRKTGEHGIFGDGEIVEYRFKIADCIADAIRRYRKSFPENNEYNYRVQITDDMNFDVLHPLFVETLEKICNEKDDEFFYNHILTDNGNYRIPSEVHYMLRDEYGLADIENLNEQDETSENVEWWVAHFIIDLQQTLFRPELTDEELLRIWDEEKKIGSKFP